MGSPDLNSTKDHYDNSDTERQEAVNEFCNPAIEKILNRPETYNEWAAKFLIENEDRLSAKIGKVIEEGEEDLWQIKDDILNVHVYPYIAKHLTFSPEEGAQELEVFVQRALTPLFKRYLDYYRFAIINSWRRPDGPKEVIKYRDPDSGSSRRYFGDETGLWKFLHQMGFRVEGQAITLKKLRKKIEKKMRSMFVLPWSYSHSMSDPSGAFRNYTKDAGSLIFDQLRVAPGSYFEKYGYGTSLPGLTKNTECRTEIAQKFIRSLIGQMVGFVPTKSLAPKGSESQESRLVTFFRGLRKKFSEL